MRHGNHQTRTLAAVILMLFSTVGIMDAAEQIKLKLTDPNSGNDPPWSVCVGDANGTNKVELRAIISGSNVNPSHVGYVVDGSGKFTVTWIVKDANNNNTEIATGTTSAITLTGHQFNFEVSTTTAKTYKLVAEATFTEKTKQNPSDTEGTGRNTYTRTSAECILSIIGVDLQLNHASSTVAAGNQELLAPMDDTEEDEEGAEIRINADFDENNKTAEGKPVEDFRPDATNGHRIIETDPDLLDGTLNITGSGTGTVTFTYPDQVNVYKKDNGSWSAITSGQASSQLSLPLSLMLKVEGIDGSAVTKDVDIVAEFAPTGADSSCTDHAFVTVVKTEFMLTFDDGPYRESSQTTKILDALQETFVNGQHVHAALFEVGSWGTSPGAAEGIDGPDGGPNNYDLTARVYTDGHHVGNHHMTHQPIGTTHSGILACEQLIRTAVRTVQPDVDPEKIFRAPYLFAIGENVLPPGYKIIWGFLTGDAPGLFMPPQPWTNTTTNIIIRLETWRTKADPRCKKTPLVVIMHDWPEPTYTNLDKIITAIRDKGYVLINYDGNDCYGTDSLSKPETGPPGHRLYYYRVDNEYCDP